CRRARARREGKGNGESCGRGRRRKVETNALEGQVELPRLLAELEADFRQPQARLPTLQRDRGRGKDGQAARGIGGRDDELGQERAVIAAHDSSADRRRENVADRLNEVQRAVDGGAARAIHSLHRAAPRRSSSSGQRAWAAGGASRSGSGSG